ncbi:hypothetical protein SASPL_133383 [Salvia splendens]|uniref:Histone deacetylase complex subunit SAP30 Sin3 binding domain-containing protein n=1 Tax=Salvia splendens TaxID=180675 RepID=A0A8X8X463_SALSN|nr:hypothetical protein SASPL_133383 [Salvia splendens]
MMETESCPSRVLSPFREESGDEELSVLPRHTKVIVTGNNRTKSVLVGLQGVVKKAVGLGGWHWLVLKNGVEVKLQRNALSVLEPPTGNEEDDDYDFDDSSSGSDIESEFIEAWNWIPVEILAELPSRENLNNLSKCCIFVILLRFSLTVALQAHVSRNPSKEQLVSAIQQHFSSQHVDEVQVIVDFIRAAKRLQPVGIN